MSKCVVPMLLLADYDIVFQEVPDETTLALNLSNCPHRCEGCHSPQLWQAKGEVLTEEVIQRLLARYAGITCVGLMGGDNDLDAVMHTAVYIRTLGRRVAWYTGRNTLPEGWQLEQFDYIKVGPYIQKLGGLRSTRTNQRFYRIENGKLIDETWRFWKK